MMKEMSIRWVMMMAEMTLVWTLKMAVMSAASFTLLNLGDLLRPGVLPTIFDHGALRIWSIFGPKGPKMRFLPLSSKLVYF